MNSLTTLLHGLGLAYAAGLNLYGAVAVTGLAVRFGWISGVPSTVAGFGNGWVIGIAATLYLIEFVATLIPGVSSAWETVHSLIRPPAAAVLAAATTWHADPVIVLVSALLGGAIAITTHTTKLGLRYAVDASPEIVTNGLTNCLELGLVASVAIGIWHHPVLTLCAALLILAGLVMMVRLIWRVLRQVISGRWMPSHGLMQAPRTSEMRRPTAEDDV